MEVLYRSVSQQKPIFLIEITFLVECPLGNFVNSVAIFWVQTLRGLLTIRDVLLRI